MRRRTRLALAGLFVVTAVSTVANAPANAVMVANPDTTESADPVCGGPGLPGGVPGDDRLGLPTGVVFAELFWRCRPEDLAPPAPPQPGPGQIATRPMSPEYLVPTRGGGVWKSRPIADAGLTLTNGGKGTAKVTGNVKLQHYGSFWTGHPRIIKVVVTYTVECVGTGKKIPVKGAVTVSADGTEATYTSSTPVPVGCSARVTNWHMEITPDIVPDYIPYSGAPTYVYDPKQPTGLVDIR